MSKGERIRLFAQCDSCGVNFELFHGWLSRLVLKDLPLQLVEVESHRCP